MPTTAAPDTFKTDDRILVAFIYCNNFEAKSVTWNQDDNQCEWQFELTEDLEDVVNEFALNEGRVEPKRFFNKFNKVRNEQFNLSRTWRDSRR